jgi:hypothetical protein
LGVGTGGVTGACRGIVLPSRHRNGQRWPRRPVREAFVPAMMLCGWRRCGWPVGRLRANGGRLEVHSAAEPQPIKATDGHRWSRMEEAGQSAIGGRRSAGDSIGTETATDGRVGDSSQGEGEERPPYNGRIGRGAARPYQRQRRTPHSPDSEVGVKGAATPAR